LRLKAVGRSRRVAGTRLRFRSKLRFHRALRSRFYASRAIEKRCFA
jgi:hypothetical protein